MKMVPLSERNYLMNARMKTTAVTKAKRKYIRKENVKNGSRLPQNSPIPNTTDAN